MHAFNNEQDTTFKFDAEIGKVLNLVINSIYTNKEIFLRELISNASDAISKRKYESLCQPSMALQENAEINVRIDRDNNSIVISDNGIGMNKEELIKNIGTIANSGTFNFLQGLQEKEKNGEAATDMIGQFGVGFYSAFMVADRISIKTRRAGTNIVYLWESDGKSDFTIEQVEDTNFNEGSEITLYLKEAMREEYLDKFRLEHIIKTYSNHISCPILLEHELGEKNHINSVPPLWRNSPSEVSKEDYQNFYRNMFFSGDEPFLTLHNKVEGAFEYTNLLFVPSKRPFDLYSPHRKTNVKLYVKKVFITEEAVKILPEYLRFIKGVIDSSELPLNISRETLQNSSVLTKIGKSITKKILSKLHEKLKKERDSYVTFWKEFGNVIKEGLCSPEELKENLLEIALFYSSIKKDYVTLDEYIENMQPGQENIYYLTSASLEDGLESPSLETFKKNNIEVLILNDPVDDFWLTVIQDYKGKSIKNVNVAASNGDNFLNKDASETIETEEGKKIIEIFNSVLSELIAEVKISYKLEESPVMLASSENGMTIKMERYLIEQKQLHASSKKVLEVNLKHPLIHKILEEGDTPEVHERILNLFDIACVAAGETLRGQSSFAKRMFSLLETK